MSQPSHISWKHNKHSDTQTHPKDFENDRYLSLEHKDMVIQHIEQILIK